MFKVLIADDEPDICGLIHKLIDWQGMDLMSLGSVQDGSDAMEFILRYHPDIVITDIQMPGMTGLEIIERAKTLGLDTGFIVVSGYREFEYARQAVRFGVEDYILKPISKTDLNLVLERVVREKRSRDIKEAEEKNVRSQLEQRTLILRNNELSQSVMDYHREFNTGLFNFRPGHFLVICVHAGFIKKEDINRETVKHVLDNIALRIRNHIAGWCYDLEYVVNDFSFYMLTNYSETDHPGYSKRREYLKELLNDLKVQYQNLRITVSLGLPEQTGSRIGEAIETAETASRLRLYSGSSGVIEYGKIRAELPESPACEFKADERKELLQLTETLNKIEALRLIRSIYRRFQYTGSFSMNRLFFVTRTEILYIRQQLASVGMRDRECAPFEGYSIPSESSIYEQLENAGSVTELCDFFCLYISSEIDYCGVVQKHKLGEPVRLAREYVAAHIDRQISLEETADYAHISPGYFCTLFKEKTGQNFTEYVTGERIKKAKELLRSSSAGIQDIAGQVGYADARYFSRVFRKTVGLKPSDYRKFYN